MVCLSIHICVTRSQWDEMSENIKYWFDPRRAFTAWYGQHTKLAAENAQMWVSSHMLSSHRLAILHILLLSAHLVLSLSCKIYFVWSAHVYIYSNSKCHYSDVIMGAMASQITILTIVYSTVYSDADQRKHQSSVSLASVWGIHRRPVKSPHKWPVTRKMFPFDDVIMQLRRVVITSPYFVVDLSLKGYH